MTVDIERLLAGDRRMLAKSISLIESQLPAHRQQAETLLQQILPHSGKSLRIGISGTPGVGKSTLIEALGQHVINLGHKLAVLAIDPSSPLAGGSILGDKTRMTRLSREPNAYIRPSPSRGQLGGVAEKTRETRLLCEAAGFDVIIVETVGVGQSEFQLASMVDFFLVLIQPYGGDQLQGMKKGILELADALVVNKADGVLKPFAEQALSHYQQALDWVAATGFWRPRAIMCSALSNTGIDDLWALITAFRQRAQACDAMAAKRAQQNQQWMDTLFYQLLTEQLHQRPGFCDLKRQLEAQVLAGDLSPLAAARQLLLKT
ncbi:MAG: methylmalonyl Co-A mutase-associated GTPase MeaB [Cellvibrionaceae bacterium]|nr:methylmalonyl Co-A mutase-associated GTPase MeaB [Cellvibrionaceae bacterium]